MFSIVIGVTGHRDLLIEQHSQILEHFDQLLNDVWNEYPDLSIRVITGLAEGADMLIATHVLQHIKHGRPIELLSVLPMPIDEYRKDFVDHSLDQFNRVIEQLTKAKLPVVELPMQSLRDDCYANLGIYLQNKSDLLVSIWNQKSSAAVGGTADVTGRFITPLKYVDSDLGDGQLASQQRLAKQQSSSINSHVYDAFNKAVFHIHARRHSDLAATNLSRSTPPEPVISNYLVSHDGLQVEAVDQLPKKLATSFKHVNELSSTVKQLKSKNVETYSVIDQVPSQQPDLERIANAFRWTDAAANRVQKRVYSIYLQAAALTLLIGWCFVIFKEIANSVLIVGYLITIVAAIAWYKKASPDRVKSRYAFYRALAETLRVEFFLRASSLISANGSHSLIEAVEAQGDTEEQAIKSIVRQQTFLGHDCEQVILSIDQVTQYWLQDQSAYFDKTLKRIKTKSKRLKTTANYLVYIPIGILVLLFAAPLFGIFEGESVGELDLLTFIKMLSQMLPVMGAAVSLYAANHSFSELVAQYTSTQDYIEKIRSILMHSASDQMKRRVLKRAAEHLSREHWSWMILTKQKVVKPKY